MTGFILRSQMNDKEQLWYDNLTEADHEELRNSYIDKVVSRNLPTSYESFVLLCAKVAVKVQGKEDKMYKAMQKTLERKGLK